jgi:hypothetical protein
MKPIVGLLLCLVCISASPIGSRGFLVDANCFRTEERNVNPDEINVPGAHDIDFEIRACYPRANKTRTFIVVLQSGEILALDAVGNTTAAELLVAAGSVKGQRRFAVDITGTISGETIYVNSISSAR